jgi:SAM-dependent methyltransferase
VTPPRVRRSLSHVGGKVDVGGDRALGHVLAHALDVPAAPEAIEGKAIEGEDRAHVHGFHAYPARMHPVTARRLIDALSPPSATVLDPFCGSGTVLVEALLTGRSAIGTDLSPIATLLATAKTRPRAPDELEGLVAAARRVAALADARRKARAGATRRWSDEDVALFEPHVLLELDSLRSGALAAPSPIPHDDLALVLSAILVKVSRQRGDTSTTTETRRLAAGYPAKLFVRKTEELAARVSTLDALLPSPRPAVRVTLDDATRLTSVPDRSIDLVLTSPPYAGTYDYLAHHALRMRWLGLDARPLERGEMGARRRYGLLDAAAAREAWVDELRAMLGSVERVLRRGASLVLLIADSVVAGQALWADEMVAAASRGTHIECVARASQSRPHFHRPSANAFRDRPRAEHALLLRRR